MSFSGRKKRRKSSRPAVHLLQHPPTTTTGTLSVAIPCTILENIQKPQLRTYVIGQLARTLTIFKVDEVIVYSYDKNQASDLDANGKWITLLLRYLETPQYLRKHLFPMSEDLKFAGLLNPIDAPHHVRRDEWLPWREGVVLEKKQDKVYLVDVGLDRLARVETPEPVHLGERVTVSLGEKQHSSELSGSLCCKTTPKRKGGLYWGYQVRMAAALCKTWEECPFEGGYDKVIGTSERGRSIDDPSFRLAPYRHLLLVFGGRRGLEFDSSRDEKLSVQGVGRHFGVNELFHDYINVCPFQGSRTIRTEEALMIALSRLQPFL
jgi:predicted SPOUT superfamily RNA methylase MTH1